MACGVQFEEHITAAWESKPPSILYEVSRSQEARKWIIVAQANLDRKTEFKGWVEWLVCTSQQFAASPSVGELASADLHFQGQCSSPMRDTLVIYAGKQLKKFQDEFLVATAKVTRGALDSWYGGLTFVDVVPAEEGGEPLEQGRQPRTPSIGFACGRGSLAKLRLHTSDLCYSLSVCLVSL